MQRQGGRRNNNNNGRGMVNNGVAKYYQVMFKKPRQEIFVGYDDRFKIGDYVKGKYIILIVCVLKMKISFFFSFQARIF